MLSEEQKMLKESADRWVKENYDFDTRRKRAQEATTYDPSLWAAMAELGWLAIPFSEEDGGLGFGLPELLGVYEAFGRGLVLEPYFSSITLGGGFVRHLSDASRRGEVVAGLAEGRSHVASALSEPRWRYNFQACETTAVPYDGGYRLDGAKSLVMGPPDADLVVVLARTGGSVGDSEGRSLFLVPADAGGIKRKTYRLRDDHTASDLELSGVQVGAESLIGDAGDANTVLDQVVAHARVCLAAEMVGIVEASTRGTQEYLGTRKQFGRPLGGFQVLAHRLTDMFVATEETRSMVQKAATEEGQAGFSTLAARTKLQASVAGHAVTETAIQLHGGIGVTEELVIGHYFRRAITLSMLLGDAHSIRRELAVV